MTVKGRAESGDIPALDFKPNPKILTVATQTTATRLQNNSHHVYPGCECNAD